MRRYDAGDTRIGTHVCLSIFRSFSPSLLPLSISLSPLVNRFKRRRRRRRKVLEKLVEARAHGSRLTAMRRLHGEALSPVRTDVGTERERSFAALASMKLPPSLPPPSLSLSPFFLVNFSDNETGRRMGGKEHQRGREKKGETLFAH